MSIAIYCRVSSKSQRDWSQADDLERWAKAQAEPVKWYKDTFTGTTMDRPGFGELWRDVLAGRVKTIAVWRLDRLGRTAAGLTALFGELVTRKVNLVSLRDGLDLSTPGGRMLANILASVAAYETEVRSERTLAGIAAAREKGVKFGRPPGKRKPIKVTTDRADLVVSLKAQGKKIAAIARLTGLSRPTVYAVLRSSPPVDDASPAEPPCSDAEPTPPRESSAEHKSGRAAPQARRVVKFPQSARSLGR
ncbi:MAG: recombinase family protein [Alphaproteobacteria bacterium]